MKKANKKKKAGLGGLLFGVVSLSVFILILSRSDIAIEYMKKGLRLCTVTVIPSLFPFMIISELIIKNPTIYKISRLLRRPMRILFGVGEAGGCAFILGTLCGFPIGAKTAVSAYDSGQISKDELSRLLCFCNNPGSAFVISAIGISLLGSKQLGIIMYVCIVLSSIIVGISLNLIFHKSAKPIEEYLSLCARKGDIITTFTSAVSSSATTMLTVCAYVVFFSALVGCISNILVSLSTPEFLTTLIFGFFEMTSGVSAAANTQNIEIAIILCAAFAAWSGISVHCQIITICAGRGLSYKQYFISKVAQGIICAVLMGISIKLLFPHILPTTEDVFMHSRDFSALKNPIFLCIPSFFASIWWAFAIPKSNDFKTFLSVDKKSKKI